MRTQIRVLVCVTVTILLAAATAFGQNGTTERAIVKSKLWKQVRERLNWSIARGEKEVRLLIASAPGCNKQVADWLKGQGATVEYEADEIDYLRAMIKVDKVEALSTLPIVESVMLCTPPQYPPLQYPLPFEGLIEISSLLNQPVVQLGESPQPPGPDTPKINPYVATADIGGPQFVSAHPTFDGRGVGIGIVEGAPDFLASELQTARGLDGERKPKIVWLAEPINPRDRTIATDSALTATMGGDKLVLTREVRSENGQVIDGDVVYAVPEEGCYRFGLFDSPLLRSIAKDGRWTASLTSRPTEPSSTIGVLWQERTGRVWVDTNGNRDFRDETPLVDFNVGHQFGSFGRDDPATPWRESVGFAILADVSLHTLSIIIGTGGHTTATSFVAVGKGLHGSRVDGMAPEAQLFPALGIQDYALLEGTLTLLRNPAVDVLWSALFDNVLEDADSTIPLLWSRSVKHYHKLILHSAGNSGPGSITVMSLPNAHDTLAIGAYLSGATWWSNFGMVAPWKDYVANLSSRGPGKNGSFKPDLLAPICQIVPRAMYYPDQLVVAGYKLPPGYSVGCGTSEAAPAAAGAAALLISAAKQSGVAYDAERLRWALKGSARYLTRWGAHEQGAGLIDVASAWELLKRMPEPVIISSRGPVKTIYGHYQRQANEGPGIFEREGWQAGQTAKRVITFRRSDGDAEARHYRVQWQGNDGTFSSRRTIVLPLGRDVTLPVQIQPHSSGIHSADLNLLDERTGTLVYQVLTTIVAAEQFSAAGGYKLEHKTKVEPLTYSSWFINVPEGTSELKLASPRVTGNVIIKAFSPWGAYPLLYSEAEGVWRSAITKPLAGVWEIVVEQQNNQWVRDEKGEHKRVFRSSWLQARMGPQSTQTIQIAAEVIGLQKISSGSCSRMDTQTAQEKYCIDLRNRFGELRGFETRAALGVMRQETLTLRLGELAPQRELEVPEGTNMLQVSIQHTAGDSADADLYLYDCTDAKRGCELKKAEAGDSSDETLSVEKPAAGRWVVVIDPYELPNGKATFAYTELMTHSRYGSVTTTALATTIGPGQQLQIEAAPEPKVEPSSPWKSCMVVSVTDQETFAFRKSHLFPSTVTPAVTQAAGTLSTILVQLPDPVSSVH